MITAIKANAAWMTALAAFLLGCLLGTGCGGPTPLLTAVSESSQANTLPGVGSTWNYTAVSGGVSFSRSVTATAVVGGESVQVLILTAFPGGAAQRLNGPMRTTGEGLQLYGVPGAPAAWSLERKLPYIIGSVWRLPNPPVVGLPGGAAQWLGVNGIETVIVPAGTFERCYRLLETTLDVTKVPDTSESVVWVSPAAGDVKYGHINTSGVLVTDHVLTSYVLTP